MTEDGWAIVHVQGTAVARPGTAHSVYMWWEAAGVRAVSPAKRPTYRVLHRVGSRE